MDSQSRVGEVPESSRSIDGRSPTNRLTTIILMLLVGACLGTVVAHAQDATWSSAPATANWNTAANWVPLTGPAAVPTGTATFGGSNTTAITFSANASIGPLQFNNGAPAYTFGLTGAQALTITGSGRVSLPK